MCFSLSPFFCMQCLIMVANEFNWIMFDIYIWFTFDDSHKLKSKVCSPHSGRLNYQLPSSIPSCIHVLSHVAVPWALPVTQADFPLLGLALWPALANKMTNNMPICSLSCERHKCLETSSFFDSVIISWLACPGWPAHLRKTMRDTHMHKSRATSLECRLAQGSQPNAGA